MTRETSCYVLLECGVKFTVQPVLVWYYGNNRTSIQFTTLNLIALNQSCRLHNQTTISILQGKFFPLFQFFKFPLGFFSFFRFLFFKVFSRDFSFCFFFPIFRIHSFLFFQCWLFFLFILRFQFQGTIRMIKHSIHTCS